MVFPENETTPPSGPSEDTNDTSLQDMPVLEALHSSDEAARLQSIRAVRQLFGGLRLAQQAKKAELRARIEQERRERLAAFAEAKRRLQARQQMPVRDALHSEEAETRSMAAQAGRSLTQTLDQIARKKQSVDTLMNTLLRETRAARRRRNARNARGVLFICALIGLGVATHGKIFENIWWILNIGGGWWAVDKAASGRRDVVHALSKSWDTRAVGVLAVALRDGDQYVRQAAQSALRNLLPRVHSGDAAYIDANQMDALLKIAYDNQVNLKYELLQALEQIGDARAIPVVTHLTRDPILMIAERAEHCLPYVTERVRRARESETLLRASSGESQSAPQELLRPAKAAPSETPAEQLLRPTEAQPASMRSTPLMQTQQEENAEWRLENRA